MGHERQLRHAELRVFISSTFRDLHEEREHLVKKIFPEIRVLCRERGIEFTEIDLRWGLTEEEETHGRIIRSCLEEIDRCRPYFIGIVGERYGWVPSLAEVYKDATLLEHYPWIEDAVTEGMSLLEMECEHGALRQPDEASGAFFYVRRGRRRPGELSQEAEPRLEKLRQRLLQSGLPVREFRDPATLAEMVYDDLIAVLERDFGIDDVVTELESERQYHEAFAANRRRAHIPNAAYIQRLDEHATSDDAPLLVHAASGSGKSALVAYWTERFRKRHPGVFVVEHYTGMGHGSGDRYDIIRHLLMEIAEHRELEEKIPEEPGALVAALPEWLAMLGDEPMVLVLDGVNQLPEEERDLHWFPSHIPANIRLIVTSTDELIDESGRHADWQQLQVAPLSPEEREALVVRYLGEFHKSLASDQLRMIASSPQAAQPLYLRTLLEELRMFGQFEVLDRQLEHYLRARDTGELFQRVLERMEEDFGARFVQDVLRLIWVSRDGLGKEEIAGITLLSRTRLNLLLNALDYHLIERSGRYTFFHTYFRDAAEHRYCFDPKIVHQARTQIADYFEQQPADERKADELPWQLHEAGDMERLKNSLVDIALFMKLSEGERQYELLGYWRMLARDYDIGDEYVTSIKRFETSGTSDPDIATVLDRVGTFFRLGNHFDAAEPLLLRALQIRERMYGLNDAGTAESLNHLGELYQNIGDYERAEEMLHKGVLVHEAIYGPQQLNTAAAIDALASLHYARKEYRDAEVLFERALSIRREVLGENHPETARNLGDLGATLFGQGDLTGAEKVLRHALSITRQCYGDTHPATADSLNNLGALLAAQEDFQEAASMFEAALAINERVFGSNYSKTAENMVNLGYAMKHLQQYETARSYYQSAIDIYQQILGLEHLIVSEHLLTLGVLLMETGENELAMEVSGRAMEIRERELGEEHLDTIQAMLQYAYCLKSHGKYSEAESYYRKAIPVKKRLLGADHPGTIKSMIHFAEVLQGIGKHEEATEMRNVLSHNE